jgi:hypothetical protein
MRKILSEAPTKKGWRGMHWTSNLPKGTTLPGTHEQKFLKICHGHLQLLRLHRLLRLHQLVRRRLTYEANLSRTRE